MVQSVLYIGTRVTYRKEIKDLIEYVEISGCSKSGYANGGLSEEDAYIEATRFCGPVSPLGTPAS